MGWQELGNVSKFVYQAKSTKHMLQNIIDKQGFVGDMCLDYGSREGLV